MILSDINMPGMTGLEMPPKVREMRPDVPIIMITAYGDPETWSTIQRNGMSQDNSWENAARKYVDLYRWTLD